MSQVILDVQKEYSCDVLVCGGGVSGFSAAVAAARCGAKTMLIESGGFLGGTATKGLVAPFMTCYDAEGKER
ncbi:MAG: FAD-dependent oxidoreductase, partial [Clostridia bacterium]|nr:FAD-dependent oxidoreductase [Clostridia bacterium]